MTSDERRLTNKGMDSLAHHIYQKLLEQGGGRWIEFNATKSENQALRI
jgi:hypothetical protein